jgi:thiamine phosphate synthase YjbQ (UPF0047 family)
MTEAARTSETSVDNHFTRQYNPEDSSEHHTRRRENLKSHICSQWLGPYEIVSLGRVNANIKKGKRIQKVHWNRLKPFY